MITVLVMLGSGGIYIYNKLTKPNFSPKTTKLYQRGFRLLEEQYGTYFKEHYKGIEKIEFSPIYIEGDNGGSMLNAYVRPTIYDKYGNKATLGTTIENYTPNSYGLVTHIFLDFDGSGNDVIELMDSHGNEIDVSNEKHLPDEAKLTRAKGTDLNIELLVEDENVDFLDAIVLIEDSSVKNVRRTSSRKNTYLNKLIHTRLSFYLIIVSKT